MPAADLIAAATAAVADAFSDSPVFACLTGSIATGNDAPSSDIDFLIVLPNELPVNEAVQQRERFTHNYVRLHRTFGRTPDLQWPGEVCYASDLDDALNGGAFDLRSGPQLHLCPETQPYRYWTSMCARGIPLLGTVAFDAYSTRCVTTLIRHIEFNQLATTSISQQQLELDTPELAEWRMSHDLMARFVTRRSAAGSPRSWRESLRDPTSQPRLDAWSEHWRHVATTHRENEVFGSWTGGS